MKTIFTLVSLVIILALTSCGKSREEEVNAIKDAHESLLPIAGVAAAFLESSSSVTEVRAKQSMMESSEKWALLKESIEDLDGIDKTDVKNLNQWFDDSLTNSGKLIKGSKPSHDDLKKVHESLSELHTQFVIIISTISHPEGTVADYNQKLSKFKQTYMQHLAMWKREM